jgi:hypothetical protein
MRVMGASGGCENDNRGIAIAVFGVLARVVRVLTVRRETTSTRGAVDRPMRHVGERTHRAHQGAHIRGAASVDATMSATWHSTAVAMANACEPNISHAGVVRRVRVGWIGAALTFAFVVGAVLTDIAWFWRLAAFVPAVVSASGFLQAHRRTCIARAKEGTFEHDDFSKTAASDEQVRASRTMAARIRRDVTIIGVLCALLAAATVFARL